MSAPEERPELLTDAALAPEANRERVAQLMLEMLDVPATHAATPVGFPLCASGRNIGMGMDYGDCAAHTGSTYEGDALPHAIRRLDLAGQDLAEYPIKVLVGRATLSRLRLSVT